MENLLRYYGENESWRYIDTRLDNSPMQVEETRSFTIDSKYTGLLLQITVVPINDGYLSVWNRTTSFLNYQAGLAPVGNCIPVRLRDDGSFDLFAKGACHVIIDVFGEALK